MSIPADEFHTAADHAAAGFQRCGPRIVRLDMLERLAGMIRDARASGKTRDFELAPAMTSLLGCPVEDLRGVLTSLGFRRVKKGPDPAKAQGERWAKRRIRAAPVTARPAPGTDTPFAALAVLKPDLPVQRPKRKKRAGGR